MKKTASSSVQQAVLAALTLATFLAGCTSEEPKPVEEKENLAKARRLLTEGKLEDAHHLLEKLVKAEDRSAVRSVVATELATVLCIRADAEPKGAQGQRNAKVFYSDAAGWARKAVKDAPGLIAGHEALGTALLGLHNLDAAMVAFQEALALDAKSATALRAMGLIEYRRGRYIEAIGRYRQARDQLARRGVPDDPRLVYNLAVALEARGRAEDLSEAKVLYRLYVLRLGTNEEELEEAKKAIDAITKRIEKEAGGQR